MPVLTRSQSKMWNARNAKHEKRVVGEWEECYSVWNGVDEFIDGHPHLERFQTYRFHSTEYITCYYQTYGGGPEGGYFVQYYFDDATGHKGCCGIYEVHRGWGQPFRITKNLTRIGARLEYETENWRAGTTARVRYSYTAPEQN